MADAVNSLNSSDPIIFSAGTLALGATSTIGSDLTLCGGTITGPGDLTVTGLLAWSGGTMSGTGSTIVDGPLVMGAADGSNQSEYLDGRTLNIAGPASYLGAGTFATSDGALVLKNPADIAFNAPVAPGSYVAYHDAVINGVDPGMSTQHYPDKTLLSVVEDNVADGNHHLDLQRRCRERVHDRLFGHDYGGGELRWRLDQQLPVELHARDAHFRDRNVR